MHFEDTTSASEAVAKCAKKAIGATKAAAYLTSKGSYQVTQASGNCNCVTSYEFENSCGNSTSKFMPYGFQENHQILDDQSKEVSQISINEVKTTDGACYLELKLPSRSRFQEGFWEFLAKYGFQYGSNYNRPLLPSEVGFLLLFSIHLCLSQIRKSTGDLWKLMPPYVAVSRRNATWRLPKAAIIPNFNLPMRSFENLLNMAMVVVNCGVTSIEDIKSLRLITAIKTPYLPDGRFDLEAYDALVNMQIENGAEGVIVDGTTGEGQLMSWDEHIMLIGHTVNCFGGSIIIGNTRNPKVCGKPSRRALGVRHLMV
ncbi:unnamed protein product [Ilex paraguariensis]|uniref:Uncharacterized protein n=1 Tax=Ilex paraguariensis TaxID=185542 RepID=A0ABC8RV07_9AQUA